MKTWGRNLSKLALSPLKNQSSTAVKKTEREIRVASTYNWFLIKDSPKVNNCNENFLRSSVTSISTSPWQQKNIPQELKKEEEMKLHVRSTPKWEERT